MTVAASTRPLGPASRAAISLIGFYRGLRAGRPSPCRFYPSCSSYAVEAITCHGFWCGGLLAARRLSRCRPFGGRGFDPVPAAPGEQ
jgi:putative membrane protein insertion efficiency factor